MIVVELEGGRDHVQPPPLLLLFPSTATLTLPGSSRRRGKEKKGYLLYALSEPHLIAYLLCSARFPTAAIFLFCHIYIISLFIPLYAPPVSSQPACFQSVYKYTTSITTTIIKHYCHCYYYGYRYCYHCCHCCHCCYFCCCYYYYYLSPLPSAYGTRITFLSSSSLSGAGSSFASPPPLGKRQSGDSNDEKREKREDQFFLAKKVNHMSLFMRRETEKKKTEFVRGEENAKWRKKKRKQRGRKKSFIVGQ